MSETTEEQRVGSIPPVSTQQVMEGIHQKYQGVVALLIQENAGLQATVETADVMVLELSAENNALNMALAGLQAQLDEMMPEATEAPEPRSNVVPLIKP